MYFLYRLRNNEDIEKIYKQIGVIMLCNNLTIVVTNLDAYILCTGKIELGGILLSSRSVLKFNQFQTDLCQI